MTNLPFAFRMHWATEPVSNPYPNPNPDPDPNPSPNPITLTLTLNPNQVATLSFLEPHKRFQNSVAVLQKRPPGWGEPVHTTYP